MEEQNNNEVGFDLIQNISEPNKTGNNDYFYNEGDGMVFMNIH